MARHRVQREAAVDDSSMGHSTWEDSDGAARAKPAKKSAKKRAAEKRATKAKRKALEGISDRFEGFRPASEVLTVVRAVPTCFVQLDHATRVGGWPIERFTLVHGPSNEGKTLAVLGLIKSFLERGHYALFVDAERTTPIDWVRKLLGPLADSRRFFAEKPDHYEGTIALVRKFLNALAADKANGIVVVDSMRKLVPKDKMAEILKAAKEEAEAEDASPAPRGKKKGGITTGRDRSAQLQAKINAAWMDELVPLLEHAGASFVGIAREMVDPDADQWAKARGDDYKVGGGGAMYYDSALVVRVERASWIYGERPGPSGKVQKVVYGERHIATIRKTKIGGKDDRVTRAYFHSSNGNLVPEGFDRARDVLELGVRFNVIEQRRAAYLFEEQLIASGAKEERDHKAVVALSKNAELLDAIETRIRACFEEQKVVEYDRDTGEVVS